jgi:hypothetical protein
MDMNTKTHTLLCRAADADHLGYLKAKISDYTAVADSIKARLIETAAEPIYGTRAFEGEAFRAVVSFDNKANTNWKGIFADLIEGADPALRERISTLIVKHTQVAEGVPCVRVYARKA